MRNPEDRPLQERCAEWERLYKKAKADGDARKAAYYHSMWEAEKP